MATSAPNYSTSVKEKIGQHLPRVTGRLLQIFFSALFSAWKFFLQLLRDAFSR